MKKTEQKIIKKNIFERSSRSTAIKIFFVTMLIFSSLAAVSADDTKDDPPSLSIVWDVPMTFSTPDGSGDLTVFGEATDGIDGPPFDPHDQAHPPAPQTPFLMAWFNDNLPVPHNILRGDYRHYPDTSKVWNLSVVWNDTPDYLPTTATISWNTDHVNASEYTSVILFDVGASAQVADMMLQSSYSYTTNPFPMPRN